MLIHVTIIQIAFFCSNTELGYKKRTRWHSGWTLMETQDWNVNCFQRTGKQTKVTPSPVLNDVELFLSPSSGARSLQKSIQILGSSLLIQTNSSIAFSSIVIVLILFCEPVESKCFFILKSNKIERICIEKCIYVAMSLWITIFAY